MSKNHPDINNLTLNNIFGISIGFKTKFLTDLICKIPNLEVFEEFKYYFLLGKLPKDTVVWDNRIVHTGQYIKFRCFLYVGGTSGEMMKSFNTTVCRYIHFFSEWFSALKEHINKYSDSKCNFQKEPLKADFELPCGTCWNFVPILPSLIALENLQFSLRGLSGLPQYQGDVPQRTQYFSAYQ